MKPATGASTRLSHIAKAHAARELTRTPTVEDYLEVIYELIMRKGYARPVDISKYLHVKSPTVTKMIQKLHDDQYIIYEKYRGLVLTSKGESIAKSVRERHGVIVNFLKLLGVDDETANRDGEGLEHHMDGKTLDVLSQLVKFIKERPKWFRKFKERLLS